jgi:hypothetical protein
VRCPTVRCPFALSRLMLDPAGMPRASEYSAGHPGPHIWLRCYRDEGLSGLAGRCHQTQRRRRSLGTARAIRGSRRPSPPARIKMTPTMCTFRPCGEPPGSANRKIAPIVMRKMPAPVPIPRLARTGAWGGGGGDGGAEPLAEGGGVLVGSCGGAAGPVMALLSFTSVTGPLRPWPVSLRTRAPPRPSAAVPGVSSLHSKQKTSKIFLETVTRPGDCLNLAPQPDTLRAPP